MKILYQTLSVTIILFLLTKFSFAQDIIIKKDQTEIKAKVLELEETKIKYKLFEHQDGPTYNISKQDVFMIIYKSGKRETFATSASASTTQAARTAVNDVATNAQTTRTSVAQTSTTSDTPPPVSLGTYLTLATNFDGWGNSMYNVTVLSEGTNLIKSAGNFMRTGFSTYLGGATGVFSVAILLHVTPHIPINRLTGNYENQNIGFFPYVRFGAGVAGTRIEGVEDESWGFGHQVAFGADYLFSKKFGVTAYSDKFKSFSAGVSFKF